MQRLRRKIHAVDLVLWNMPCNVRRHGMRDMTAVCNVGIIHSNRRRVPTLHGASTKSYSNKVALWTPPSFPVVERSESVCRTDHGLSSFGGRRIALWTSDSIRLTTTLIASACSAGIYRLSIDAPSLLRFFKKKTKKKNVAHLSTLDKQNSILCIQV